MPLLSFPARNLISDKKLSATISTLYYTNCNHNLTNICQRKEKCGKNRGTNLGGAIEAGFSGPWRDGGGNTDIEEVRWLEGGLQEIIRGGFAKGIQDMVGVTLANSGFTQKVSCVQEKLRNNVPT